MDPMELEKLMMLLQQQQQQQPQMGVPPGRFGPGQPAQAGMPVDQIPGMTPQPGVPGPMGTNGNPQERGIMDMLRQKFMSGGAGDLRNIAMALGPAAQAAGGMGGALRMGQQMGMPAKAAGMPPVDRMFDMAQQAPKMAAGPGAAQAGRGLPLALGTTAATGYGGYKAVDAIMEMQKERERQMQLLMQQMGR